MDLFRGSVRDGEADFELVGFSFPDCSLDNSVNERPVIRVYAVHGCRD
jgi:hypothetical protein